MSQKPVKSAIYWSGCLFLGWIPQGFERALNMISGDDFDVFFSSWLFEKMLEDIERLCVYSMYVLVWWLVFKPVIWFFKLKNKVQLLSICFWRKTLEREKKVEIPIIHNPPHTEGKKPKMGDLSQFRLGKLGNRF